MKELLGDNIALLSELETFNGPHHLMGIPWVNKPHLREVSWLPFWIYCFLAYLALRCMDKETRERLVYAQLIMREALRQGGKGWLTYDKVFRQQAAINRSLKWNKLHPAILASTVLSSPPVTAQAAPGLSGAFCSICQGVDHRADQCALSFLHNSDTKTNGGRSLGASNRICISWYWGRCKFPAGCSFRHVCSVPPATSWNSVSSKGSQGPPPGLPHSQPRPFTQGR